MHTTSLRRRLPITALAILLVLAGLLAIRPADAMAVGDDVPFSLQVTPSPLVASLKPGESKTLELRIRNDSANDEELKTEMRAIKASGQGEVQLQNDAPKDVEWVKFENPTFKVKGGEWFTQHVQMDMPKDAGFSYSFAIVVSRATEIAPPEGKQALQGAVAVFTLVNVDRPDATRKFMVEGFQSQKRLYEYLPANFSIKLKNDGNTIVQPFGNVFIQRKSGGQPLAVLPINGSGGYILPDRTRTFNTDWSEGFPVYRATKSADNVEPKTSLAWDWGKAQHFRFGKYVAKMIAVYNDGQRDVPIEAEITFWVIPWKLLTVLLLVLIILVIGVVVIVRRFARLGRRAKRDHYEAS